MMASESNVPQATVRVLLVDDHPILRSGLKALIDAQDDMTVVGEAGDGLEAVNKVLQLLPHVVVMDLAMPTLGGVEATERIKAAHPDIKVVALTAREERSYVQQLISAGASGYVLKRAPASDLMRAIRAIAMGGIYLDPAMAAHAVAPLRQRSQPAAGSRLSDRESEVLRLIAEGHGIKEIAASLAISTRTLETYRSRAMEKLALKKRADIVRYALQRGWLKNV